MLSARHILSRENHRHRDWRSVLAASSSSTSPYTPLSGTRTTLRGNAGEYSDVVNSYRLCEGTYTHMYTYTQYTRPRASVNRNPQRLSCLSARRDLQTCSRCQRFLGRSTGERRALRVTLRVARAGLSLPWSAWRQIGRLADRQIEGLTYCGALWPSGSDSARGALGPASLAPMWEGEGSIPVRDVGCSPRICDTD